MCLLKGNIFFCKNQFILYDVVTAHENPGEHIQSMNKA